MKTKHIEVNIDKIESNPFRNLKRLPLKPEKVQILKDSIDTTGFWENIVVRVHPSKPGFYQLAYGHHRLQAVKESGIKSATFIVSELSDELMVKIMANENMQEWSSSLNVIVETVIQTRDYLNDCIKRGKVPNVKLLYPDINTLKRVTKQVKDKKGSVGLDAIHRFLGNGWSRATISRAMDVIKNVEQKKIAKGAVMKFQSPRLASDFVKKMIAEKVKPAEQVKRANKILDTQNGQPLAELLKPRVASNVKKNAPVKAEPKKAVTVEQELDNVTNSLIALNKLMQGIEKGYKGLPKVKRTKFETHARAFVKSCERIGFVSTQSVLIRKPAKKSA